MHSAALLKHSQFAQSPSSNFPLFFHLRQKQKNDTDCPESKLSESDALAVAIVGRNGMVYTAYLTRSEFRHGASQLAP